MTIKEKTTSLTKAADLVLGQIKDRLMNGGYPTVTSKDLESIFASFDDLVTIPKELRTKTMLDALPETYPGTGFRFAASPLEIQVTPYGLIGPTPASVRKTDTDTKSAEVFLASRAGDVARLHYLYKLSQNRPYLFVDNPYFSLDKITIIDVLVFYDTVTDIVADIKTKTTKQVSSVDLKEHITDMLGKTSPTLMRTPEDVNQTRNNHRFISYLKDPGPAGESYQDMQNRQTATMLLICLYDIFVAERVVILPTSSFWGPSSWTVMVEDTTKA